MLVGCLQRNNQMWSETVITFWLPWCNTCTSEYNSRRPASKSCYISMIMMLMTKLVFYWISFSATGIILQEEETGPLLRSCLIAFWSRHHMATHILSPTDWSSTALSWKTTTSWRDVPRSWTRRSSMQRVQMNSSATKRWVSHLPSPPQVRPLFLACSLNATNSALLLLSLGADPNIVSRYGSVVSSPLHRAAFNNNPAVCRSLLASGAKQDDAGWTWNINILYFHNDIDLYNFDKIIIKRNTSPSI